MPTQGHVFIYSLSLCPKEPPHATLYQRGLLCFEQGLATAALRAFHQRRLNFDVETQSRYAHWTPDPLPRPAIGRDWVLSTPPTVPPAGTKRYSVQMHGGNDCPTLLRTSLSSLGTSDTWGLLTLMGDPSCALQHLAASPAPQCQ